MSFRKEGIKYRSGDEVPATNLSPEKVEDYARNVAEVAGFKTGQNPEELAERYGGRVRYQSFNEMVNHSDGEILVHGPNDFDIFLPQYTNPRRDRFTIAHELGHYFLHSSQGTIPIIVNRAGSERIEWEANWFAASLLMPAREMRETWQEKQGNLAAVAERFQVSFEAARVRLVRLGLLEHEVAQHE